MKRQSGFGLIDFLLSLAIIGIIIAMVIARPQLPGTVELRVAEWRCSDWDDVKSTAGYGPAVQVKECVEWRRSPDGR